MSVPNPRDSRSNGGPIQACGRYVMRVTCSGLQFALLVVSFGEKHDHQQLVPCTCVFVTLAAVHTLAHLQLHKFHEPVHNLVFVTSRWKRVSQLQALHVSLHVLGHKRALQDVRSRFLVHPGTPQLSQIGGVGSARRLRLQAVLSDRPKQGIHATTFTPGNSVV